MQPVAFDVSRQDWVDPALALPLLESVEELEPASAGAFLLGEERQVSGMMFVQQGSVCWAVSERMRGRLTDLLLGDEPTSEERDRVEALYRDCKQQGRPLGEALVEVGIVSSEGLRRALLQHTCEAIVALGRTLRTAARWVDHDAGSYDATFTFPATEIYVGLAAVQRSAAAQAAEAELARATPAGCPAAAFVRDGGGSPIVTRDCEALGVRDLHELGRWTADTVDIADAVNPTPKAVAVSAQPASIVMWSRGELLLTALCRNPAEFGQVTLACKR
jgi:hypothetical protein